MGFSSVGWYLGYRNFKRIKCETSSCQADQDFLTGRFADGDDTGAPATQKKRSNRL